MIRLIGIVALLLVAGLSSPAGAQSLNDAHVAAIARSIDPRVPERTRASLLVALRQLESDALAPMFRHMASSEDPLVRRHGVLGVAERDAESGVNVLMLMRDASELERATLIGDALTLGLLSEEQIIELLRWEALDPTMDALLRCRLVSRGQREAALDHTRLATIAESEQRVTRVLAKVLMAEAGERIATSQAIASFDEAREAVGDRVGTTLAWFMLRFPVPASAPVLRHALDAEDLSPERRGLLLEAMLAVDPAMGNSAWRAEFEKAEGFANRLRLALVLLAQVDHAAEASIALLGADAGDGSLLALMADAARGMKGERADAEALLALAATRHEPSEAWLVEMIRERPDSDISVVRVLNGMLERQAERGGPPRSWMTIAAGELARRAPLEVRRLLEEASDRNDDLACLLLLDGLHGDGSILPWDASDPPEWPSLDVASTALVYEARVSPHLFDDANGERRQRLARVGAGEGGAREAYRLQAAWLTIEWAGESRRALARLMTAGADAGR